MAALGGGAVSYEQATPVVVVANGWCCSEISTLVRAPVRPSAVVGFLLGHLSLVLPRPVARRGRVS